MSRFPDYLQDLRTLPAPLDRLEARLHNEGVKFQRNVVKFKTKGYDDMAAGAQANVDRCREELNALRNLRAKHRALTNPPA